MTPDHRQAYSILKLLINGQRMAGGYTIEDAVSDYLSLHPDAKEMDVRAELTRELAKGAESNTV